MNSIKLAIITILLTLSVATVQADTTTPNILSAVAANSLQTLSDTEASKIRGEYRDCYIFCLNIHLPFAVDEMNNGKRSRVLLETYTRTINWGFFSTHTKMYVAR